MIVPVRKDKDWWWTSGEITLDWMDVPSGSTIFQRPYKDPLTVRKGESARFKYFGSIGMQASEEEDEDEYDHYETSKSFRQQTRTGHASVNPPPR